MMDLQTVAKAFYVLYLDEEMNKYQEKQRCETEGRHIWCAGVSIAVSCYHGPMGPFDIFSIDNVLGCYDRGIRAFSHQLESLS